MECDDLSGQDWVLMEVGQELMILKPDGNPMTFPSREAASAFNNKNLPSAGFEPAKVIDISSHLSPSKRKN